MSERHKKIFERRMFTVCSVNMHTQSVGYCLSNHDSGKATEFCHFIYDCWFHIWDFAPINRKRIMARCQKKIYSYVCICICLNVLSHFLYFNVLLSAFVVQKYRFLLLFALIHFSKKHFSYFPQNIKLFSSVLFFYSSYRTVNSQTTHLRHIECFNNLESRFTKELINFKSVFRGKPKKPQSSDCASVRIVWNSLLFTQIFYN